jgi:hypothetical protein
MPLSVRIDPDTRVVWATGSGNLTRAEILEGLVGMVGDPLFEPGCAQLCDLRDVTGVEVAGRELRQIVAEASALGSRLGSGKLAIVAERPVVYGLSRMYEVFTEDLGIEAKTFRDRDEAMKWLGIVSQ